MNLKKSFKPLFKKRLTAVEDVTFDVRRGEVFALLGPNGAGKSTTISLIRGDIAPDRNGGDVLVEGKSVTHDLAGARSQLGVCPQFDPMDKMTVREHLEFYARVRGVSDVQYNVRAVLRAVGLAPFASRMAHTLSGGNKRKLSLGIALMGNPTVVLLDEPSSGLDAAAKRIMWNTLKATVAGRSILLTTHSMEEADALAGRVGILAKSMLALGTIDELRARFGNILHVHLVSKTAPRTPEAEMQRVRDWVRWRFPEAEVEEKTYHGQMRFSLPASAVLGKNDTPPSTSATPSPSQGGIMGPHEISPAVDAASKSAIGKLVVELEENREALGIEHFSVSPTTLDKVFLMIVGEHNIKEENY
jgi:ABC-type multidrug transport system ATPase subunit